MSDYQVQCVVIGCVAIAVAILLGWIAYLEYRKGGGDEG
jgi:hypothetical protein